MIETIRFQPPKEVIGGDGGYQYEPDATKSYWERGLFMNYKSFWAIKGS
jgi:hypothetical protein